MIEAAEPIFPLEIVRRMRDQRCSLIQTPVSKALTTCSSANVTVLPNPLFILFYFIFFHFLIVHSIVFFIFLGTVHICPGSSIKSIRR